MKYFSKGPLCVVFSWRSFGLGFRVSSEYPRTLHIGVDSGPLHMSLLLGTIA